MSKKIIPNFSTPHDEKLKELNELRKKFEPEADIPKLEKISRNEIEAFESKENRLMTTDKEVIKRHLDVPLTGEELESIEEGRTAVKDELLTSTANKVSIFAKIYNMVIAGMINLSKSAVKRAKAIYVSYQLTEEEQEKAEAITDLKGDDNYVTKVNEINREEDIATKQTELVESIVDLKVKYTNKDDAVEENVAILNDLTDIVVKTLLEVDPDLENDWGTIKLVYPTRSREDNLDELIKEVKLYKDNKLEEYKVYNSVLTERLNVLSSDRKINELREASVLFNKTYEDFLNEIVALDTATSIFELITKTPEGELRGFSVDEAKSSSLEMIATSAGLNNVLTSLRSAKTNDDSGLNYVETIESEYNNKIKDRFTGFDAEIVKKYNKAKEYGTILDGIITKVEGYYNTKVEEEARAAREKEEFLNGLKALREKLITDYPEVNAIEAVRNLNDSSSVSDFEGAIANVTTLLTNLNSELAVFTPNKVKYANLLLPASTHYVSGTFTELENRVTEYSNSLDSLNKRKEAAEAKASAEELEAAKKRREVEEDNRTISTIRSELTRLSEANNEFMTRAYDTDDSPSSTVISAIDSLNTYKHNIENTLRDNKPTRVDEEEDYHNKSAWDTLRQEMDDRLEEIETRISTLNDIKENKVNSEREAEETANAEEAKRREVEEDKNTIDGYKAIVNDTANTYTTYMTDDYSQDTPTNIETAINSLGSYKNAIEGITIPEKANNEDYHNKLAWDGLKELIDSKKGEIDGRVQTLTELKTRRENEIANEAEVARKRSEVEEDGREITSIREGLENGDNENNMTGDFNSSEVSDIESAIEALGTFKTTVEELSNGIPEKAKESDYHNKEAWDTLSGEITSKAEAIEERIQELTRLKTSKEEASRDEEANRERLASETEADAEIIRRLKENLTMTPDESPMTDNLADGRKTSRQVQEALDKLNVYKSSLVDNRNEIPTDKKLESYHNHQAWNDYSELLEARISAVEERIRTLTELKTQKEQAEHERREVGEDNAIIEPINTDLDTLLPDTTPVENKSLEDLNTEKDAIGTNQNTLSDYLTRIPEDKLNEEYHNHEPWNRIKGIIEERQTQFAERLKLVEAEIEKKSQPVFAAANPDNYPVGTVEVTTTEAVAKLIDSSENPAKLTVGEDGGVAFSGGAPSWNNGQPDKTVVRFGKDVKSIDFVTMRSNWWIITSRYTGDTPHTKGLTGSEPLNNNAFDTMRLPVGTYTTFYRKGDSPTTPWGFNPHGMNGTPMSTKLGSYLNTWIRFDISDGENFKIYQRPLNESTPYQLVVSYSLADIKAKANANFANLDRELALGAVHGIANEGSNPNLFQKLIINRGIDSDGNPIVIEKSSPDPDGDDSPSGPGDNGGSVDSNPTEGEREESPEAPAYTPEPLDEYYNTDGDGRYHLLVVAGQSNAVGYDESPALAEEYPINDRLWQYGVHGADNLKIVPLTAYAQAFQDMSNLYNPASTAPTGDGGYKATKGIQYPLAELLLKEIPKNDKILVVSASYGGVTLVDKNSVVGGTNSTLTVGQVSWGVQTPMNKTFQARLDRIFQEHPNTKYLGTVWIQGEHGNSGKEGYARDFRDLFDSINGKLHELTNMSLEQLDKRVFPTQSCRTWRKEGQPYVNHWEAQKSVFPLTYVEIPLPEVPSGTTDPTSNETNGTGKTASQRQAHYGNNAYKTLLAPKVYEKYLAVIGKRPTIISESIPVEVDVVSGERGDENRTQ